MKEGEEEPVPDLEKKLKVYQEYVAALGPVHDIVAQKHFCIPARVTPRMGNNFRRKAVFTLRTEITPPCCMGF